MSEFQKELQELSVDEYSKSEVTPWHEYMEQYEDLDIAQRCGGFRRCGGCGGCGGFHRCGGCGGCGGCFGCGGCSPLFPFFPFFPFF